MKIDLMIGIPMYGGQAFANCFVSVIGLSGLLRKAGIPFRLMYLTNESMITRARNKIAKQFLKSDCTHLLFIDADMGFNPEGVLRMIDEQKDIIAAVYPKKTFDVRRGVEAVERGEKLEKFIEYCAPMTYYPLPDQGEVDWSGPVEVAWAGTGLMLIRRQVFEELAAHVESFVDDEYVGEEISAFFLNGRDPDGGGMMGEDHFFCKQWTAIGGKIFIAPWLVTDHMGTYRFTGPIKDEK